MSKKGEKTIPYCTDRDSKEKIYVLTQIRQYEVNFSRILDCSKGSQLYRMYGENPTAEQLLEHIRNILFPHFEDEELSDIYIKTELRVGGKDSIIVYQYTMESDEDYKWRIKDNERLYFEKNNQLNLHLKALNDFIDANPSIVEKAAESHKLETVHKLMPFLKL